MPYDLFPEYSEKIFEFLQGCPMASISTLSGNKPESAVIAFTQTKEFEIVFETFFDTRKYTNLQKYKNVALATGFSPTHHITFQYEGVAKPMSSPEEINECKTLFASKDTPCGPEFLNHPKVTFWKITPTWLRYSDYTGSVPVIVEKCFC